MSTRCQIRIVKNGYPLNYYHHCDGYFSGVGKELQGWLKEAQRDEGVMIDHISQDPSYELTFYQHTDIEYFYLIDFDEKKYKGYEIGGYDPWANEGEDEYDQYKPWYNQMPKNVRATKDLLKDEMVDEQDE